MASMPCRLTVMRVLWLHAFITFRAEPFQHVVDGVQTEPFRNLNHGNMFVFKAKGLLAVFAVKMYVLVGKIMM